MAGNISSLSTTVSTLQAAGGNLWSTGTNSSIHYNAGKVGIGATTPNSSLHIYKGAGENAEIDIQSVTGANKHWGIYQDRTSESLKFWNSNAGGDMVTFTKDGKVGIGTVNPSQKLEVNGGITISDYAGAALVLGKIDNAYEGGEMHFQGANNYSVWIQDIWGNTMRFLTSNQNSQVHMADVGTGSMGLYVQGNVGIGTTAPSAKLEVAGNIIASTPVSENHVATKDYVDTKVANAA